MAPPFPGDSSSVGLDFGVRLFDLGLEPPKLVDVAFLSLSRDSLFNEEEEEEDDDDDDDEDGDKLVRVTAAEDEGEVEGVSEDIFVLAVMLDASLLCDGELVADFSADMLGLPEFPCFGDEVPCLGLVPLVTCFGLLYTGECFGLCLLLDCFSEVGLALPTRTKGLLRVGEGLNLRSVGDVDRDGEDSEAGLMLTDTGFDKGSCFKGNFSGGPMGLESLLRLRFFSSFSLLSSRFFELLFLSLRSSPNDEDEDEDEDFDGLFIAVIVIELGKEVCVKFVMGMISIPGLRSNPMLVSIEL